LVGIFHRAQVARHRVALFAGEHRRDGHHDAEIERAHNARRRHGLQLRPARRAGLAHFVAILTDALVYFLTGNSAEHGHGNGGGKRNTGDTGGDHLHYYMPEAASLIAVLFRFGESDGPLWRQFFLHWLQQRADMVE
jgi:hypothetical protein